MGVIIIKIRCFPEPYTIYAFCPPAANVEKYIFIAAMGFSGINKPQILLTLLHRDAAIICELCIPAEMKQFCQN